MAELALTAAAIPASIAPSKYPGQRVAYSVPAQNTFP
jgi:hypothetical protein